MKIALLVFSFFFVQGISTEQSKFDFRQLVSFVKCSNLSMSFKTSFSYRLGTHPLILNLASFEKPSLLLNSLVIKSSYFPLFYGNSISLTLQNSLFSEIYNQTIHLTDKRIDDKSVYYICNIAVLSCNFVDCMANLYDDNLDSSEYGGAFELIYCDFICKNSLFYFCFSNHGGAIFAQDSKVYIDDTNFTLNEAKDDSAALSLSSCSHARLNKCVFESGNTITASALSAYNITSFQCETCYFLENNARDSACICLDETMGRIRNCEFYHNYCSSIHGNEFIGVISLTCSKLFSILSSKFADNMNIMTQEADIDIYVRGNGIANVRFCIFDKKIEEAIRKQISDDSSPVVRITSCDQNLNAEFVSKKILKDISQSKVFKLDYSQFNSIYFAIYAILGSILMFISIALLLSFIVGGMY